MPVNSGAMAAESYVCEMEKEGMLVVRRTPRSSCARDRCWKWLGALSFAALFGATVMVTLLYFGVIPSPRSPTQQGDLMREKAAAEHYINPIPQQLKLQARESRKPAAHLIADLSQKNLTWVADKGHAFMENGMEIEDNKLVVPSRGLYFVYSQVVFYGRSCTPKQSIYLSHKVNKHSVAYPVDMPLLSATKSSCEGDTHGHPWYETIYQGGVFTLDEGDVISTDTTETAHLDTHNAQNYFGAIAM